MFDSILENVRRKCPLIHNITNYVTVNDCANILLACGASPIMADDKEEVADITSVCAGLNINIGTLNSRTIDSMLIAGKQANILQHPVLLDPVGAGASKLRTETAYRLLKEVDFSVIRGNISEIKTLALGCGTTKGVDADIADKVTEENLEEVIDFVKAFDGDKEAEGLYNAVSSKGNYKLWLETIRELRQNKIVKILMASTLASPLIEKLSIQPYIVNLWSSLSGNGKTLLCMTVMSIWGNPDVGSLRLSSNSTANYCASLASFLRNITCYFDELQIIKNTKYTSLESLIMDLCNGTEKGRLNKNSQLKEVKTWFCNFLFTNNERMVNENAGEQIYNRVIDIEINQKIFEKPHETANIIRNNYGFFGKEYIKVVQKIGFDKINKRFNDIYERIIKETEITDKQANSLVSIIVADEIIVSAFFKDEKPLCIEDVKEYINNKNEIKTSVKAKEYIIGIINANIKRFDESNYGEYWGYKDEYHCTINAQILFRELAKGGYEFNTVKQEWANEGFLEKNSQGKFIHQTTVRKEKGNYIKLKMY